MNRFSFRKLTSKVSVTAVLSPGTQDERFLEPLKDSSRTELPTLPKILTDSVLCVAFRKYMFLQFAEENLLLWLDIDKWKTNYSSLSPMERISEVKRLAETYFHEKSPYEVNLDFKIKSALESQLLSGVITVTMFNQVQKAVYDLMETSQLNGFLASQSYQSLLSPVPRRSGLFQSASQPQMGRSDLPSIRKDANIATSTSSPTLFSVRPSTSARSMPPAFKIESKAKQYLASQKEKWSTYQKSIQQAKISKSEMAKMKHELHRLEMQLVQAKKMITVQENLRKKIANNVVDNTTLIIIFQQMTEAVAIALETAKSSIWFFCSEEKTNITAVNIFERTHNKHYKDITLVPAVHGRYFRALLTEEKHEQLPLSDGRLGSPRLKREPSVEKGQAVGFLDLFEEFLGPKEDNKSLEQSYTRALALNSIYDVPIKIQGSTVGLLVCEHPGRRMWSKNEDEFLRFIADMLSDLVESVMNFQLSNGLKDQIWPVLRTIIV